MASNELNFLMGQYGSDNIELVIITWGGSVEMAKYGIVSR